MTPKQTPSPVRRLNGSFAALNLENQRPRTIPKPPNLATARRAVERSQSKSPLKQKPSVTFDTSNSASRPSPAVAEKKPTPASSSDPASHASPAVVAAVAKYAALKSPTPVTEERSTIAAPSDPVGHANTSVAAVVARFKEIERQSQKALELARQALGLATVADGEKPKATAPVDPAHHAKAAMVAAMSNYKAIEQLTQRAPELIAIAADKRPKPIISATSVTPAVYPKAPASVAVAAAADLAVLNPSVPEFIPQGGRFEQMLARDKLRWSKNWFYEEGKIPTGFGERAKFNQGRYKSSVS